MSALFGFFIHPRSRIVPRANCARNTGFAPRTCAFHTHALAGPCTTRKRGYKLALLASLARFSAGFTTRKRVGRQMEERNSKLMNVGQAADYLGVSSASLRKWSNDGLVPVFR